MRLVLQLHHPAFRYSIKDLKDDLQAVGFEGLDFFVWHADTTRVYNDAREAAEDLGGAASRRSCPSHIGGSTASRMKRSNRCRSGS